MARSGHVKKMARCCDAVTLPGRAPYSDAVALHPRDHDPPAAQRRCGDRGRGILAARQRVESAPKVIAQGQRVILAPFVSPLRVEDASEVEPPEGEGERQEDPLCRTH